MLLFDSFMLGNLVLMLIGASLWLVNIWQVNRNHLAFPDRLVFRKSIALRGATTILSINGVLSPLMIIGNSLQHHKVISTSLWVLLLLFTLLVLLVSLLVFRLGGPEDLLLDTQRQMYQRTTGWSLFPTIYSGTWEDIEGIYVQEYGASIKGYIVGIAWASQRGRTQLAKNRSRISADQFADKMSKILRSKRIDPPYQETIFG